MMNFSYEPFVEEPNPFFENCVDVLSTSQPFAYAKINHGFWERLALIQESGIDFVDLDSSSANQIDTQFGWSNTAFAEDGFLAELFQTLHRLPAPELGFNFVPSINSWPGSWTTEGTPLQKRKDCVRLMQRFVPSAHLENAKALQMTGYEFKTALITGDFHRFTDLLTEQPLLIVANTHLVHFGSLINTNKTTLVEIDPAKARWQRTAILDEILQHLKAEPSLKRIIIQAGGSLATWLIVRLFETHPDLQIFDLGVAMTVANPQILLMQNWAKIYHRSIEREVEKIHPGWNSKFALQTSNSSFIFTDRDKKLVEVSTAKGAEKPTISPPLTAPVRFPDAAISFIENKAIDWDRVKGLLRPSFEVNHHANGGPAASMLEDVVRSQLPPEDPRQVLVCSSGTAALFLATSIAELKADKQPFKWIASSFGFYSSKIGRLSEARLIDSEPDGAFSLNNLMQIPIEDWDGVILTNVFAQHSDWEDVRAFCLANGKKFIVDNATGLLDRPTSAGSAGDLEAISAHHTKPWGIGECGFLIAPPEDIVLARRLSNFGAGLPSSFQQFSLNAKISDLACATIIDRMERMRHWSVLYHMQERRLLSLINNYGLKLTPLQGKTTNKSPRAYLPMLSTHDLPQKALENPVVALRKYYPPLQSNKAAPNKFEHAQNLYAKIVCIPCNPEMRLIPSDLLAATLQKILGS